MTEIIDLDSPIEKIMKNALAKSGIRFRDQENLYQKGMLTPKYIVDFVVFGEHAKVAVECDGSRYHSSKKARSWDAVRDIWLLQNGFDDVIRFSGRDIIQHVENCILQITKVIEAIDKVKENAIRREEFNIARVTIPDAELVDETIQMVIRELKQCMNPKPINNSDNNLLKVYTKRLKKELLNERLKVNDQMVYFVFPWLMKLLELKQIDGHFVAYNIPFVFKIYINPEKPEKLIFDSKLMSDRRIIKIFIYMFRYKDSQIPKLCEGWVIVDGINGKVKDSDILEGNLKIITSKDIRKKILNSSCSESEGLKKKGTSFRQKSIVELRELALNIGKSGYGRQMLIEMFSNPDYEVRRRACSAARKLQDIDIVKHIVPCLYAKEPQVRQYALKAVLESKCTDLLQDVRNVLECEDKVYNIELCRRILKRN